MNTNIGPLQHVQPHKNRPTKANKPAEAVPQPQDEATIGDTVTGFAGDTVRTIGGTASAALKTSSLAASSVLKGMGVEEKTAERLGGVGGLLAIGASGPVIMATGAASALAIKGFGVESKDSEQTEQGAFSEIKDAYVDGVNEAYDDGAFFADKVMDGTKTLADKAQKNAGELGSKALEKGKSVTNQVIDGTTEVVKNSAEAVADMFSFLWK